MAKVGRKRKESAERRATGIPGDAGAEETPVHGKGPGTIWSPGDPGPVWRRRANRRPRPWPRNRRKLGAPWPWRNRKAKNPGPEENVTNRPSGPELRLIGPSEDDGGRAAQSGPGRGACRLHRSEEAGPDLQDPQGAHPEERADVRRGRAGDPARRVRVPAQPRL